ncbi:CHAD domain-containing protein [Rubrobacter indicoceani]|uniref:CYTH and CHAD domain-containing protein n=1 Tax=Rubrobacter indicoceani TaxID=2051957 RepID=UPI000E5A2AAE|nr:CHAD domain-containing protein [Rubrobacter indicoceani]
MKKNHDVQEVEWQFDALDLRPVLRWLAAAASPEGAPDGFTVEPLGERKLSDSYLDTADWSVFRAGYALRIRRRDGEVEATIKRLSSLSGVGPKVRREISEPFEEAGALDFKGAKSMLGDWVRSLCGDRKLLELFEVQTSRRTCRLLYHAPDGEEVSRAEIALDETEIPVAGGRPVSLRRVEVELEAGEAWELHAFVENLAERFRLSPSRVSKYEAGLFGLGLTPPEQPPDFGQTELSPTMPTGEYAFAVLREQFRRFLAHEPGTRIGEAPDELHDMRVASRRMRAAIKLFGVALPTRARHFDGELRWVATFLGEVRDLDVQLSQIEAWASESDGAPGAFKELRRTLEVERDAARRKMLLSLESSRYGRFLELYSGFLRRGPSPGPLAGHIPVTKSGAGIISRAYRKFRKHGDRVADNSPVEAYHSLRKRGKRLRYALEFLTPVYGGPAEKMVATLKTVQDVLGDHQDAAVAAGQLSDLAPASRRGRSLAPRTYFIMGKLAARYEAEMSGAEERFSGVYPKIKGKPWKRFRRSMKRTADEGG